MYSPGDWNKSRVPRQETSLAASRFWIGVESMPPQVLQMAVAHPRPILCGQIADLTALRAVLGKTAAQAEWHDLSLDSPIGQGYLLDLLRQRQPIEHIVLALPSATHPITQSSDETYQPLDDLLSETRHAIEGLIAVMRGAEGTLDASAGAGMTLLRVSSIYEPSPLVRALGAFSDELIAAEAKRWATLGLSLEQLKVALIDQ